MRCIVATVAAHGGWGSHVMRSDSYHMRCIATVTIAVAMHHV